MATLLANLQTLTTTCADLVTNGNATGSGCTVRVCGSAPTQAHTPRLRAGDGFSATVPSNATDYDYALLNTISPSGRSDAVRGELRATDGYMMVQDAGSHYVVIARFPKS